MSFATDKWFKHLREEILTEGLGDIGLPQELVDIIRSNMPSASEKGRVWVGNAFKDTKPEWQALSAGSINPSLYDDIGEYQDRFGSYYQNQGFNILEELLESMGREKYSTILKKRKSFIKSSKKLGVDQKIANSILQFVDDYVATSLTSFLSMIENTVLTLNQDPNNYKKAILFDKKVYTTTRDPDTGQERTRTKYLYDSISDFPPSEWNEVEDKSAIYQESRDKEELTIQTFDDGSYWYDLESNYCEIESERMGHCGGDNRGTLYSLRKKDKGQETSKSYVTVAYNKNSGTIFQIKGRFNECPPRSLWPYIAAFVDLVKATTLSETGEHSGDRENFQKLGEYLSEKTGINFQGSLAQQLDQFKEQCETLLAEFRDEYGDKVLTWGLDIEVDHDYQIRWEDVLQAIVVEMPFAVPDQFLMGNTEDTDPDFIWEEKLLSIIRGRDRSFSLRAAAVTGEIGLGFVKAASPEEAESVAQNAEHLKGIGTLGGNKYYFVLNNLQGTVYESLMYPHVTTVPAHYGSYLAKVGLLADAIEISTTDIKKLLEEWVKEEEGNATLQEGLIVEGLADIGLSDKMVEQIRFEMPNASEKGRMWIGNALKSYVPYQKLSPLRTATQLFLGLMLEPVKSIEDDRAVRLLSGMPAILARGIAGRRDTLDALEAAGGVSTVIRSMGESNVKLFGDFFQVGEFNLLKDYWEKISAAPIKDWNKARKSFIKSCSKKGIEPEAVNKAVNFIDLQDEKVFNSFRQRVENTILTLNQSPANYQRAILFDRVEPGEDGKRDKEIYLSISDFPPSESYEVEERARFYQSTLENEEQIIYKFDNGVFWYDLGVSMCSTEGKRMGHCGGDSRGKLYSLRKKQKDGLTSSSFVTIAYNDQNKTIFQIKGKFNNTPDKKLWPYIAEFIKQAGAKENLEEGEFNSEEEMIKTLEMGAWLTKATGIKSQAERLKMQKMKKAFQDQCEYAAHDFMLKHSDNVYDVEPSAIKVTEGPPASIYWEQEIRAVAIHLDFKVKEGFLKSDKNELSDDKENEMTNKIFEILADKDSNKIIDLGFVKKHAPAIRFVRSNWGSQAIIKGLRANSVTDLKGGREYMVVETDDGKMFEDFIARDPDITTDDPNGYRIFLEKLGNLIVDMKSAVPLIQDYLTTQEETPPMQEARENPLDVRLYEIDFVMSYPLGQGFEITDIHNIVRAIPDVTTVRTIGNTKRTQGNRTVSLQRLKFALQGQKSRKEWVRQVLIPQIHKISSAIRLHRVEPAELASVSKQRLEELYYQTSMRQSPGRTTPVPTIQSLIDDWVEGGVMYDAPTNINLTRYSVMMPVEDLKHLCGREARKHGHHFDAGYQKFIENGPRDPIYLAIGKNGRAKITGNEDDLRYAIKAGVEEVPVFISYQRQV
jgi:hypothetical protein